MIQIRNLIHDYLRRDEEGNVEGSHRAIDRVNLDVHPGEFIAILGHNGSGKSTLAKEEDVGFGPENMGVPTEEIWERVNESLRIVEIEHLRKKSPNRLSGGQKQRVSIAGVIAMHPKCIILDEPTAMLDPSGRKEVIRAARALNKVEDITIILITHYMEEAIYADRVFVMDEGKIAMQGTPREVFSDVDRMKELRLDVPQVTLLADELRRKGLDLPAGILTADELADALGLKEETDVRKQA